MTGISGRRHSIAGFGVFTLLMVALFAGLAMWQLQRRVEKHALIAALTERLAEAPGALPSPAQWSALTPAQDEFRRVSFVATYQPRSDAMVYSSGSAVRDDVTGPGTWAFMPAALPTGETVVINTGFVQNTMQDREQQDRIVARLITNERVMLTGYIRGSQGIILPWRGRSAGARAAGQSRRSMSIWSSRCPRAAFQNPVHFESISRTTTCNTPSPGLDWRARW
jgi:cytochrome oxidase assembly protein ShyY1